MTPLFNKTPLLLAAALAALPAVASAHLHITSDVVGPADARALAFTTYGETDVTIDNGQLLQAGLPLTYTLDNGPLAGGTFGGAFDGFLTGPAPTLTSDLPAAQAALAGADVQYELAAVTPVTGAGGAAGNVLAYSIPADPTEGVTYQSARTDGPTLADRSLDYGVGEHLHGVSLYSRLPGLYDLTLIAHDANGLLADSAPVSLRVNAVSPVPEPASLGLLGGAGLLLLRRRRAARIG